MGAPSYRAARNAALITLAASFARDAGPGRRDVHHQRRRHRVDDRRHRAGADDDDTGPGAVLFRHGAQEERAGDDGAEPRCRCDHLDSLGGVRLFAGLRRRRSLDRHARSLVPGRHDDGQRQPGGEDDPGSAFHAVPDDVCDHHGGAGGGRGGRPDAVLGLSAVLASAGSRSSMCRSRIGCGAAVSSAPWACWISPAASSCIFPPASAGWLPRR